MFDVSTSFIAVIIVMAITNASKLRTEPSTAATILAVIDDDYYGCVTSPELR